MPDLTGLIVNYNSGPLAQRCAESFRDECERAGLDPQIVLVDNDSPFKERDYPILRAMEANGVEVIYHDANPGYSGGMNLAFTRAQADTIAVLNPDLLFEPGAVKILYDYVHEHPSCGVAGPLGFYDPEHVIVLPCNEMPTLWDHWRQALAHMHPWFARRYARRRARYAHAYWHRREPTVLNMLSGACMFLRRDVVERIEGFFDERFPLYYEDADFFRRVIGAGLDCTCVPEAQIVHFYSQSADTVHDEAMRRYWVSQREYFLKWNGPVARLFGYHLPNAILKAWPKRWNRKPPVPFVDLGRIGRQQEFRIPSERAFYIELCHDPMFFLAGAILSPTNPFRFPESSWRYFGQTTYYMRAVDVKTHEALAVWSFMPEAQQECARVPASV
ncbi:MAG: glycosyltransferase family 2 protein [Planctomycetes bacterium]|nr:glycosyltransferase family 2 protein [Planctomycetota bacterium]